MYNQPNPIMSRGTIVKDPRTFSEDSIFGDILFCRYMQGLKLCELDDKGKPTDNQFNIIPREFPPNFEYATKCDGEGQQVEFDLVYFCFFWKRAKVKWIICR